MGSNKTFLGFLEWTLCGPWSGLFLQASLDSTFPSGDFRAQGTTTVLSGGWTSFFTGLDALAATSELWLLTCDMSPSQISPEERYPRLLWIASYWARDVVTVFRLSFPLSFKGQHAISISCPTDAEQCSYLLLCAGVSFQTAGCWAQLEHGRGKRLSVLQINGLIDHPTKNYYIQHLKRHFNGESIFLQHKRNFGSRTCLAISPLKKNGSKYFS